MRLGESKAAAGRLRARWECTQGLEAGPGHQSTMRDNVLLDRCEDRFDWSTMRNGFLMINTAWRVCAPVLLATCSLSSLAHAQQDAGRPASKNGAEVFSIEDKQKVKFSLLASTAFARPGETVKLGLRFVMQPNWHIYWNGTNDTGEPPKWKVSLPEGWTADDTAKEGRWWPVPTAYAGTADLRDHVYFDEVVLLQPMTIAADAKPGEYSVKIDANWLVCEDACIPEKGSSAFKIVVVGHDEKLPELSMKQQQAQQESSRLIQQWSAKVSSELKPQDIGAGKKVEVLRREGAKGERFVVQGSGVTIGFLPSVRCLPLDFANAKHEAPDGVIGNKTLTLEVDEALANGMREQMGLAPDADALKEGVIEGIVLGTGSGVPIMWAFWVSLPFEEATQSQDSPANDALAPTQGVKPAQASPESVVPAKANPVLKPPAASPR